MTAAVSAFDHDFEALARCTGQYALVVDGTDGRVALPLENRSQALGLAFVEHARQAPSVYKREGLSGWRRVYRSCGR